MGQATVIATTDNRRWFSALRPLVLLGGFVLVWWFLMTGAAQANGGPDGGLADTARSATGTVERVAHRPARGSAPADEARQQHRAPVAHLTQAVRQRVEPAVSPVTTPVAAAAQRTVENTVKPVTTRTTDMVRSTVRKVVKDVRSGLENGSTVIPEPGRDELVLPPLKSAESSTRVGETHPNATRTQDFRTASSMLPAAGAGTVPGSPAAALDGTSATTHTSGQDTAIPTPADGANTDGSVGSADHEGAVSAPSGNGSLVAADQNAHSVVMEPAASSTSTVTSVDRLPAGPAYPPASSPD